MMIPKHWLLIGGIAVGFMVAAILAASFWYGHGVEGILGTIGTLGSAYAVQERARGQREQRAELLREAEDQTADSQEAVDEIQYVFAEEEENVATEIDRLSLQDKVDRSNR